MAQSLLKMFVCYLINVSGNALLALHLCDFKVDSKFFNWIFVISDNKLSSFFVSEDKLHFVNYIMPKMYVFTNCVFQEFRACAMCT